MTADHPTPAAPPSWQEIAEEIAKQRDDARAHLERQAPVIEDLRAHLQKHYLFDLGCDHERKMNNPWCACSAVNLGWHPSVGEAVQAWLDHVLGPVDPEATAQPSGHGEETA